MSTGAVLATIAVILSFYATMACLIVWSALVFPQPVGRARERLQASPGRCFLVGLPLMLVWAFALSLALREGLQAPARLVGWGLLIPLSVCGTLGGAGLASLVGERMQALSGAMSPLGALVRGVVVTELATVFPLVGWVVFGPAVACASIGAGILAWRARARPSPAPEPAPAT